MPKQNVKRTKRVSGNSTNHLVHVLMVKTNLKTTKKNQMMMKRKMKNQLMKSKIQAARILKIWSQKIAVLRLAARSTENNNSFVNSNVQKEPTSWAKMVGSKLMNLTWRLTSINNTRDTTCHDMSNVESNVEWKLVFDEILNESN